MTQATAVAVHFYSLLMTWGQAGSAEHKQYRLSYWGLGLGGDCVYVCALTHACLHFGWVWPLKYSILRGNLGITVETLNELCDSF